MNAAAIITEDMTLEEKLAAIDAAMEQAQEKAKEEAESEGKIFAPLDPAELTLCEGCQ